MKLDHLVLMTRQLDDMAADFHRLGFALTPLGEHGASLGTANRCVTFADQYIELLGLRTDTPENATLRALYAQSATVTMTSLRSEDIDTTHRYLRERGIEAIGPIHFARDMGEDAGRLEFGVLPLVLDSRSELPTFFTMHKTPEILYSSRWSEHPNGAKHLLSVEVEVNDPFASARIYAALGVPTQRTGSQITVLQEGPRIVLSPIGTIPLRPRHRAAERLCQLRIAVAYLQATRAELDARKIAYSDAESELNVQLEAEHHYIVSFVQDVTPPKINGT